MKLTILILALNEEKTVEIRDLIIEKISIKRRNLRDILLLFFEGGI